MGSDKGSTVRNMADIATIASLGAAAIGTVLGWAKVTRELTAPWPFFVQMVFYVALFVVMFSSLFVLAREVRRVWRWLTNGTLGDNGENRQMDMSLDRLEGVELQTERTRAIVAEGRVTQLLATNEALSSRFVSAEGEARRHAEIAAKATANETQAISDLEVARSQVIRLSALREGDSPNLTWLDAQIAYERDNISRRFEVVKYVVHVHEISESVSASLMLEVVLRYWGLFSATVGEEEDGALVFLDRHLSMPPVIGAAYFRDRGQTQSVWIRQLLGGDKEAVLTEWNENGKVAINAARLKLAIRCEAPDGSAITGWLNLDSNIEHLRPVPPAAP